MKATLAFKNVWQWQVTSQIEFGQKEPFVYTFRMQSYSEVHKLQLLLPLLHEFACFKIDQNRIEYAQYFFFKSQIYLESAINKNSTCRLNK